MGNPISCERQSGGGRGAVGGGHGSQEAVVAFGADQTSTTEVGEKAAGDGAGGVENEQTVVQAAEGNLPRSLPSDIVDGGLELGLPADVVDVRAGDEVPPVVVAVGDRPQRRAAGVSSRHGLKLAAVVLGRGLDEARAAVGAGQPAAFGVVGVVVLVVG